MVRRINRVERDITTVLMLVEHLEHAYRDASAVASGDELEAEHMRFNSVAMDMIQAQECARKLSPEFHEAYPDLPWNEMRGMRNIIVHQYDEIDADKLYESATIDAPELLDKLRPYIDSLEE